MVLDSSLGIERPAEPGSTGDDVFRVIDGLRSLPRPIPSREALVEALTGQGFSLMLARWVTTNLDGSAGEGYRFRFDLDGIGRLIGDYFTLDAWPVLEKLGARVHVVRGDRSDRISEADSSRLADLGVPVTTLSAGHWVQVDAPDALREVIALLAQRSGGMSRRAAQFSWWRHRRPGLAGNAMRAWRDSIIR